MRKAKVGGGGLLLPVPCVRALKGMRVDLRDARIGIVACDLLVVEKFEDLSERTVLCGGEGGRVFRFGRPILIVS